MTIEIVNADCLPWMQSQPEKRFRLTLTSPPYTDARTYSIGFKLTGQGWVDWMIPRIVEMCRVTDGLVIVNMAGKVKNWQYQPVVEWLVADLTRHHGIACGPAPYVFSRVGVPGSGSTHYHRRDWEPVYCFALPDRLPLKWSDNTALGHPPKWAPGGSMSNRLADGSRVNQWGHSIDSGATTVDEGGVIRSAGKRPSHVLVGGRDQWGGTGHASGGEGRGTNGDYKTKRTFADKMEAGAKLHTKHDAESEMREQAYLPPVLANPGNVIHDHYTADDVLRMLAGAGMFGDVIRCNVGGGQMGDSICHENEAPFPERLAEFFIRSYCPPDEWCLDPFGGSGTVSAVCEQFGRHAVYVDIRDDNGGCDTARRRLNGDGQRDLFPQT